MSEFYALITAVITMFILLLIGYFSRRLGFMDDKLSKGISTLIICVAQPFMIIGAIIAIPYSPENVKTGFLILLLGIAVHFITAVIAFFATFRMRDNDQRRITKFSILFANCGFLGFPILRSVFGDIGVFWGSFYVIVYNIVSWTYGMYVLGRARSEIKMNFVKMFLNYGTTPCIIGLILFFLRVKFPAPVLSAFDYMGSLCTPLSMLIIGGLLATIPVHQLFTNIRIYYLCLIRLIVVPVTVTLLGRLIGLSLEFSIFTSILSAMPTAANSGMFAEKFDLKPVYAAHGVGMTTLFSAATVPLIVLLSKTLYSLFPA